MNGWRRGESSLASIIMACIEVSISERETV